MTTRTKVTLLAAATMLATAMLTATASARCHHDHLKFLENLTYTEMGELFDTTKQVNDLSSRKETPTTVGAVIDFFECINTNATHADAINKVTGFARTLGEWKTNPDGVAKNLGSILPDGQLKENMRNWVDQVLAAPTMAQALNLVFELQDKIRKIDREGK